MEERAERCVNDRKGKRNEKRRTNENRSHSRLCARCERALKDFRNHAVAGGCAAGSIGGCRGHPIRGRAERWGAFGKPAQPRRGKLYLIRAGLSANRRP